MLQDESCSRTIILYFHTTRILLSLRNSPSWLSYFSYLLVGHDHAVSDFGGFMRLANESLVYIGIKEREEFSKIENLVSMVSK
jgi:hypothetical protein